MTRPTLLHQLLSLSTASVNSSQMSRSGAWFLGCMYLILSLHQWNGLLWRGAFLHALFAYCGCLHSLGATFHKHGGALHFNLPPLSGQHPGLISRSHKSFWPPQIKKFQSFWLPQIKKFQMAKEEKHTCHKSMHCVLINGEYSFLYVHPNMSK